METSKIFVKNFNKLLNEYSSKQNLLSKEWNNNFISKYVFHRSIESRSNTEQYMSIKSAIDEKKGLYAKMVESNRKKLRIKGNYVYLSTKNKGVRIISNYVSDKTEYILLDWDNTYSFLIFLEESSTLRIKIDSKRNREYLILNNHPVCISGTFISNYDLSNESLTPYRIVQCKYYINIIKEIPEFPVNRSLIQKIDDIIKNSIYELKYNGICKNWYKVIAVKRILIDILTQLISYLIINYRNTNFNYNKVIDKMNIFSDIESVEDISKEICLISINDMNNMSFIRKIGEYATPMFLRYDIPNNLKPVYKELISISMGKKGLNDINHYEISNIFSKIWIYS